MSIIPAAFAPTAIAGGALASLAAEVTRHYAQNLEGTRIGRILKHMGLLDPTFQDKLRDVTEQALRLYFETYPDYAISGVLGLFRDEAVGREIGRNILAHKQIDEAVMQAAVAEHFSTGLNRLYLEQRKAQGKAIDLMSIVPNFLECFRQVLIRHADIAQIGILLELSDQTQTILDEMEANTQKLLAETQRVTHRTPQSEIRDATIKILDQAGRPKATGFFVTNRHILTCEHCVRGVESVAFTFSINQQQARATVWKRHKDHDTAVLHFDGTLPDDVSPLPICGSAASSGNRFRAYGYPKPFQKSGKWAAGLIHGSDDDGWLQFDSKQIDRGMSGAPLYDDALNHVVGVVSATYYTDKAPMRDESFALPIDWFEDIWPELPLQLTDEIALRSRLGVNRPKTTLAKRLQVSIENARREQIFAREGLCGGYQLQVRPTEYYLAQEFNAQSGDFERALERSLADTGLSPVHAKSDYRGGYMLCKISALIRETPFGVYLLPTSQNPTIYLQLGLALGMGRPFVLVKERDAHMPPLVAGLDFFEMRSYRALMRELGRFTEQYLFEASTYYLPIQTAPKGRSVLLSHGGIDEIDFTLEIAEVLGESGYDVTIVGGYDGELANYLTEDGRTFRFVSTLDDIVQAIQAAPFGIFRAEQKADSVSFLAQGIAMSLGLTIVRLQNPHEGRLAQLMQGMNVRPYRNLAELKMMIATHLQR